MRKNIRDKSATIKFVDWSVAKNIPNNTTLQDCLQKALENNHTDTSLASGPELLELIHCQIYDGSFVGVLGVYEEGKSVEGIRKSKKTKKNEIYQTKLPEGEKLESALYFCVVGDQVAISQSVKLKAKALQDHISKLIKNCYEGFEGNIILTDRISDEARKMISAEGVEEISLGQEITDTGADAIKIANGIFGAKVEMDWSKRLGSAFNDNKISGLKTRVVVELFGKEKKSESLQIINALALGMCNDLEGVTIRLGNGKVIKKGLLFTTKDMHVTYQDGCPILTEMFKGLRFALKSDCSV